MTGEFTQELLCFEDGACSFVREGQSRYLLVMNSKPRVAGSPSSTTLRIVQRCGHWEIQYGPILISTCDQDRAPSRPPVVPSTWPGPTAWFPAPAGAKATIEELDIGRLARDLPHRKASPTKNHLISVRSRLHAGHTVTRCSAAITQMPQISSAPRLGNEVEILEIPGPASSTVKSCRLTIA